MSQVNFPSLSSVASSIPEVPTQNTGKFSMHWRSILAIVAITLTICSMAACFFTGYYAFGAGLALLAVFTTFQAYYVHQFPKLKTDNEKLGDAHKILSEQRELYKQENEKLGASVEELNLKLAAFEEKLTSFKEGVQNLEKEIVSFHEENTSFLSSLTGLKEISANLEQINIQATTSSEVTLCQKKNEEAIGEALNLIIENTHRLKEDRELLSVTLNDLKNNKLYEAEFQKLQETRKAFEKLTIEVELLSKQREKLENIGVKLSNEVDRFGQENSRFGHSTDNLIRRLFINKKRRKIPFKYSSGNTLNISKAHLIRNERIFQ